jgi:hypothetical protein
LDPCPLWFDHREAKNQLSCELLPGGPKLTTSHSAIKTGSVGFTTYRSSACFDYLLVLPAP